MNSKPLIGLNADYRESKNNGPAFAFLCTGYFELITRAHAIPIVIPPLSKEKDLVQVLDLLDGIVLVGGSDLDPRNDGFMTHPSLRLIDSNREDFDRLLIQHVAMRRMPVLGIGAGAQLINVSQGGTLHLHVPEDLPRALPHLDPLDPNHRHALEITPNSLMERVYGEGEIRVNSMHHMAIDDVAPGFVVTARCPDGVIEAIESVRDDWLAVGTQFHPESPSASALDKRIFEEFLDDVLNKNTEQIPVEQIPVEEVLVEEVLVEEVLVEEVLVEEVLVEEVLVEEVPVEETSEVLLVA